jgi:alkanesulfonate monooxygenase SsuD/methylene tetrahydromethanopterin reductase-like flavin-dependent oxidoreductase (luciferase family)
MGSTVRFGVMGNMFPPIDQCLESMRRAEAAGWDFIDFADQIQSTHPLGMLKSPQPASDPALPTSLWHDAWYGSLEMCSVASVLTKDVGIFLGVIDALRRSPAVMAQEMATVAELSKGRARFAVAAGEEKQFAPYGEKVLRLAGEVADGWMTYLPGGVGNDLDKLAETVDAVKRIAADAGRDPDRLAFNAQVILALGENDEQGWEYARHPNNGWLAITAASIDSSNTWERMGYENPLGNFTWSKDMRVTLLTPEIVADMTRNVPDEMTDASVVWGGPERVAKRVQAFIDAGINEISFFNMAASIDPESGLSWEGLVSQVMTACGHPGLRLSAATSP